MEASVDARHDNQQGFRNGGEGLDVQQGSSSSSNTEYTVERGVWTTEWNE